jgi:starch synthase (maltosyl-transferring)
MIDGRARVVIGSVSPSVDGGRYAIKRAVGDSVNVIAVAFADGHDQLRCQLRYRYCPPEGGDSAWQTVDMIPGFNDEWSGSFVVHHPGVYEYTVRAWVDRFASWLDGLRKKVAAGVDVAIDCLEGALLMEERAALAVVDGDLLRGAAGALRSASGSGAIDAVLQPDVVAAARAADPAEHLTEWQAPRHRRPAARESRRVV